ncbi:fimbrial biogenesis chaperone [Budvicia diplopodorum]|uniref:fimbrial biogenesis chaperone n=1 Tax=Budvicia diplopodorum TaxID=1119056 RepID=UPI00135A45DC|nr:molecular chaperone [Budvicia diplopodorum]
MKMGLKTLTAALLIFMSTLAQAGVTVGGTRLVYNGEAKESTINVTNPDNIPYLIQSWVDNQDGVTSKPPFVVTPPLFRLNGGGQENVIRVIRTGGNLPEDKESLFWLNIKSIPSAEKTDNSLQIAVKTRIKLLYRPKGVTGTLEEAAGKLTWQRRGNSISVTNPTPYYITFFSVKLNGVTLPEVSMVAPNSTASFKTKANVSSGALNWTIINDFGGVTKPYAGNL